MRSDFAQINDSPFLDINFRNGFTSTFHIRFCSAVLFPMSCSYYNLRFLLEGQTSLLSDPYPNTVAEPALYDTVRAHAEGVFDEVQLRSDYSVRYHVSYLSSENTYVPESTIQFQVYPFVLFQYFL